MSNIEWTDETWNPVVGCAKVSPGCANCYAESMSKRLAAMARADEAKGNDPGRKANYPLVVRDDGHWNGRAVCVPEALPDPLGWKKPRRVFVNSMSDLFHADVPFDFIDRVFAVMALCPQHTFQVLTKRPERMAEYFGRLEGEWRHIHLEDAWRKLSFSSPSVMFWPLPNVWLGTSVENQAAADERIPHLLRCPAKVRFLSCEPLLGAVRLDRWVYDRGSALRRAMLGPMALNSDQADASIPQVGIHWVIVGGESGPNARSFNVQWARDIIGQCKAAGVPCFVKQLGAKPVEPKPGHEVQRSVNMPFFGSGWSWLNLSDPKGGDMAEWPEDLRVREMPEVKP